MTNKMPPLTKTLVLTNERPVLSILTNEVMILPDHAPHITPSLPLVLLCLSVQADLIPQLLLLNLPLHPEPLVTGRRGLSNRRGV